MKRALLNRFKRRNHQRQHVWIVR